MASVKTSDFAKGMFIIYHDEPHQITDLQYVNPGKGSAFVRTKLKNLKTGRVQEFTYKSGESVEEYPVYTKEMQYLYKEGDKFVFMDNDSYEQHELAEDLVGDFARFIKEGDIYQILTHDDEALGMRPPKKIRRVVTEAEDAVKGNTIGGARKLVTIETGTQVPAPLFIKTGDIIGIDTETGEYVERINQ